MVLSNTAELTLGLLRRLLNVVSAFQFLDQFSLDVGAHQEIADLEEAAQRIARAPVIAAFNAGVDAMEKMFETQAVADTLIERLLVDDQVSVSGKRLG